MDEPTEGLAPHVIEDLASIFQQLKKKTTLFIVEQNLPLVARVADRVYSMKEGKIVAEQPTGTRFVTWRSRGTYEQSEKSSDKSRYDGSAQKGFESGVPLSFRGSSHRCAIFIFPTR
jgi:energy-coupling factor transporter ATP-binding protein EcfA2